MKTCCGHEVEDINAKIQFCRAHCKETSGCYNISINSKFIVLVAGRIKHATDDAAEAQDVASNYRTIGLKDIVIYS